MPTSRDGSRNSGTRHRGDKRNLARAVRLKQYTASGPIRAHECRLRLRKILAGLVVAIALGHAATAVAQPSGGYLGVGLDSRTLSVQAKAEELFDRGDYRRARIIYLSDLAPIGDKYAQYMLGFMSLSGLGVEQDPVLASAWYRLAAERGEPGEFVAIRNDLLSTLDAVDRERSDQVYLALRREYSDIAISMREAREEFEKLTQITTGSRLGSTSAAVTIVDPGGGSSLSRDALVHRSQRRMQAYLDNITAKLGIDRIDAETVSAREMANLEERVRNYVQRLEGR